MIARWPLVFFIFLSLVFFGIQNMIQRILFSPTLIIGLALICPWRAMAQGELLEYTITTQEGFQKRTSTIQLFRTDKQVMYVNDRVKISDLWSQTPNGLLKVSRYYDREQFGIDYEPLEINAGKGASSWADKRTLFSDASKKTMKKTSENTLSNGTFSGQKVEKYTKQSNGVTSNIDWMPELNAVLTFTKKGRFKKMQWSLKNIITDQAKIQQAITQRENYDSMDFADIGDNESHPFVRKMISLGFVGHSTGFYDTAGNQIKSKFHRHY